MADEAFALSPISARATQPSEEDYDAIREAFMETARGRWFLGEYAKRNRNADTRMVLDAVARIEETMAAQRQAVPDSGLAEALIAIRRAVGEARAATAATIDSLALEEALVPVRKGIRVIREIAWRWREIGADSRICDLLDSQVGAIEASCGQITSTDPKTALNAVFDRIEQEIAAFDDSDTAPQEAAAASGPAPSSPAPTDQAPAPDFSAPPAASVAGESDVAMATPAAMPAETVPETAESAELSAEATAALDEAVLDLVALEMAAPDPVDVEDLSDPATNELQTVATKAQFAAAPPADPVIVARPAEPAPPAKAPLFQPTSEREPEPSLQASPEGAVQPSLGPSLQPSADPSLEPSLEPSLGSSLIASGILRKRNGTESDCLSPIRRMSQAEKIAFFS